VAQKDVVPHEESLAFGEGGSLLGEREALLQWCTRRSASAAPERSGLEQSQYEADS